jgi:hypothetical protein
MTTLSILSPPLRRLFSRIDSAPQPRSVDLARLLEYWRDKRGAGVLPRLEEFDKTEIGGAAASMFVYRPDHDHAYTLVAGRQAVSLLLGKSEIGDGLAQAKNRRAAARLRRLFDCANDVGEPVLGKYRMSRGQKWSSVEILAAPVADAESSEKAVFGGVSVNPT